MAWNPDRTNPVGTYTAPDPCTCVSSSRYTQAAKHGLLPVEWAVRHRHVMIPAKYPDADADVI